MIILLIIIIATLVGIGLLGYDNYLYKKNIKSYRYEDIGFVGLVLIIVGGVALLFSIFIISFNHAIAKSNIEYYNIKYDALCKNIEVVNSDENTETSKTLLIQEIIEWNQDTYEMKHWANSPWTNVYNSKLVADSLKYIDINLIK